jgi:hypothetical protein
MARRNVNALSTGQLVLNNKLLGLVPNTFSFTSGRGEYTHRRASTGGNGTVAVFSKNAETFKSMPKFELFPTTDNLDVIDTAKLNNSNNTLVYSENGKSIVFTNLVITNDPEFAVGADTTVSVEAEADPINE